MKANRICVNGEIVDVCVNGEIADAQQDAGTITLPAGISRIVLEYASAGRTWFVLDRNPESTSKRGADGDGKNYPLASGWYRNTTILPLMDSPEAWKKPCQFRTVTPSGTERILIHAAGLPQVWFAGEKVEVRVEGETQTGADAETHGSYVYSCDVSANTERNGRKEAELQIVIPAANGRFGADCLESIEYQCKTGLIQTGDWGETEGLGVYSGGIRYRKRIDWKEICTKTETESGAEIGKKGSAEIGRKTDAEIRKEIGSGKRILCDLGEVGCSAELLVNGVNAGVRLSAPYRFDITGLVHAGENCLEVEVFNSLYNHYRTVPNYYNDRVQKSGLIGPVRLIFD